MVVNIYGVFTALTSSAVLISLYVVFLFVEQHYFSQKMDAFFPQKEHRKLVKNIISHGLPATRKPEHSVQFFMTTAMLADLNAIGGAIQDCEFWLNYLEKPTIETPKAEDEKSS